MTDKDIYSPAAMREAFREAQEEISAIESASGPLREDRDKHVQEARALEDEMNAQISAIEEGLFEKKNRLSMLSRALGGKTGDTTAPEVEAAPAE